MLVSVQVAWLYNVRGSDVSYCPVVHAFAIVTSASAFFYVDKRKSSHVVSALLCTIILYYYVSLHFTHQVSNVFYVQVNTYMEENGIEVRDYGAVSSDVVLLASDQLTPSSSHNETDINPSKSGVIANGTHDANESSCNFIWIDPRSCCFALYSKLNPDQVLLQSSPLALAKAIKVFHFILHNF